MEKFILSTDIQRRNEILNEINSAKCPQELSENAQKVANYLLVENDWQKDLLITNAFRTKINILNK